MYRKATKNLTNVRRGLEALLVAGLALLYTGCASSSMGGSGGAGVPSVSPPSLPSPPSMPSAPSAPSAPSPPSLPSAPQMPKPPSEGDSDGECGECNGGAQTGDEAQADLDEEFKDSLSEFDEKVLEEKEVLAAKRPNSTAGDDPAGGEAVASAAGDGGFDGSMGGSAEPSEGGQDSQQSAAGDTKTSGASPSAPTGSHAASSDPEGEEPKKKKRGRVPSDIPDGRDDDIVARQLREAAMNEDDPELREKLWDEYRRYKGGGK